MPGAEGHQSIYRRAVEARGWSACLQRVHVASRSGWVPLAMCRLQHVGPRGSYFPGKSQTNRGRSYFRVCADCEMCKTCYRCGKKLSEQHFPKVAWKARNADRRVCHACRARTWQAWKCVECKGSKPQQAFTRYSKRHPSRQNGTQVCDGCSLHNDLLAYAWATRKRLARRRAALKAERLAPVIAAVKEEIAALIERRKAETEIAKEATVTIPTPPPPAPPREAACGTHSETQEKLFVYTCPFCNGAVKSQVYSGKIEHRNACGHQFRVQNGQAVRVQHEHVCPRCGTTIVSSKASGRVQSKHRTPKGKACPQSEWVVRSWGTKEHRGKTTTIFRPALGWSSLSNVASKTYKKRRFCSFGAHCAPRFGLEMHRLHLRLLLGITTGKTATSDPKAFPKRLPPEQGKSMAWRAQWHRFSSCVGVSFNVKRRVQNLKKKGGFCSWGLNLHLQLPSKYTVGTFRCVWASRRAKPRLLTQKPSQKGCLRNRETAWPGELKDTVFRPALEWSSMSNVASRIYKKREFFAAVGLSSHHDLASRCTVCTFNCVWVSRRAKPRLLTQKPSQKGCLRNRETAWPGELKDTVFRPALEWSSMSNVASRIYKKREFFAAVGLSSHHDLASRCTVCTFNCVWVSRPAKPRLLTQKPSRKGCLRNRETAWPGELKDTVFWPVLGWSSVSNVASRTHKKWGFGFEIHRWHLQLRLGVTTCKTTTSDPNAFPKRLPPEQGNSMAWRAQGHRFLTCVGVIFSVKRCVQNL